MKNIKITSKINRFKTGITNWLPVSWQGLNPKVNWFFLLDPNTEKIRCFDEDESKAVLEFLSEAVYGAFGNNISCFIDIAPSFCENDKCEREVLQDVRDLIRVGKPFKITPDNFGIDSLSEYRLEFGIIGYFQS